MESHNQVSVTALVGVLITSALLTMCGPSGQAPTGSPSVIAPAADRPVHADWAAWARDHARQTGDEGLGHLVAALEAWDSGAALPHSDALRDIVANGWRAPHPEIADLIRLEAPALQEAVAAAEADDITFSDVTSHDAPIPNFLNTRMMFRLLLAEARRLEEAGEPGPAARRAVQTVRLAEHLRTDNVTLIQHLVAIAGEHMALKALASILRHPGLEPVTLQAIQGELERLEGIRESPSALLRAEERTMLNAVRQLATGSLPGMDQEEQTRQRALVGDLEEFERDHERLWGAVLANLDRPRWEREAMSDSWVRARTNHPLLLMSVPNFDEAVTRSDTALALQRLCETLVALRLGETPEFIDPFDGSPIRVGSQDVWSIGPDGRDDLSRVSYDPTNGTISAGDIVAQR